MKKKTKILQVCRLSHLWGMDLFKEITKAFKDDKYEVTTVVLSNKPGFENYKGYKDYTGEVIFFGINHRGVFWRFIAIWNLIKLFKIKSFDAVIAHHYKPMVLVEIASRFFNIPKMFSINHDRGNLRTFCRKLFVKYFLSHRWKFISVSDGIKHDLLSAKAGLSEDRVITIYNGIDVDSVKKKQLTRSSARKALGIPENCFLFGNIARLVPRKGQKYLIQAFTRISHKNNCWLAIIGLGNLENDLLEIIANEGVQERVTLETDLAKDAVKYLKAFDAFVLPSLVEPFGIVLIEAMSAKLPLIGTNVDGIPEVIGDSGTIVPPGDINALADAMDTILALSSNELEQLGLNAYHRLIKKFTIENYHKAFQEIIT